VFVPSERPVAIDNLVSHAAPIVAAWRAAPDLTQHKRQTPVTHSYAALAFFTEGSARMEQNIAWQIRAGDMVLIPAGQPHRMIEHERAGFWGVAFCVSCLAANSSTSTLLEPFEKVRDGGSAVVTVPEPRQAYLAQLFRELAGAAERPQRDKATLVAVQQSLLTLILNEADVAFAPRTLPSVTPSVVTESLRFIERNCLRPLTLQEVASAVGRSPAYVTNTLSRATGRSAVEWIVSARMAEARRLLLHSDELVDVIAERVGYADATHFIRMFRREHGATPAAWRAARAK
jgi:AraC family transcriptional regulator, transcriptional activator of pobA